MAIHHLTPPFSGGERPRLPSAQVGPVTQAIRAMRAADPASAVFEAQIGGKPFDWQAETASHFTADAAIEAIRTSLNRCFFGRAA